MEKEELPDIYKFFNTEYGCSDFKLRAETVKVNMTKIKDMKTWETMKIALEVCGQIEKKREYDWKYLQEKTKNTFITSILWKLKHDIFRKLDFSLN